MSPVPLSVLVCVLPGRGHVSPTAAVVEGLLGSGHRVRVITGRKYADVFTRLGAEVLLMPVEADFDDADLDASFPLRKGLRGLALARHDLRESFVRPMPQRWAAIQQAMAAEPVHVVLCDPVFLGAIPLLLTRQGGSPRVYVLGFVPLALPPLSAPGPGHRVREAAMGLLFDAMTRPVQKEAEDLTMELSGQRLPCRFLDWTTLSDVIVQMSAPSFEYPRSDAPVPIHFVGPLAATNTNTHPLPDWWGDLDGRRVVHVTQGTVANEEFDDLVNPTIEALADSDVLVVVATGGRRLERTIPSNVRLADFLPYDQLLPRCELMITNGGYGGVNLALRHGVPLLVVGSSEDKRLIAQRVSWSGAGIGIGRQRVSARRIAREARRILDDPRYARNAGRIADEIAAAPGVQGVVDLVDGTVQR